MKSKKNITLIYKKDGLPENFASALRAADENDLRLLLAVSLLAEGDKLDCASLAESVGLCEAEADASIKYWCGAGFIKKGNAKTQKSAANNAEKDTEKSVSGEKKQDTLPQTAHREGLLERSSQLPSYSSAELSDLIEKRKVTAEFVDEAQRVLGRVFNSHEVGILVGMVDYIGLDEQGVIMLLSRMARDGKKSLRYAEKLAFTLYDMGLVTAPQILEYFDKLEAQKSSENEIRAMFGMTGRDLSTKEKKFLKSWISTMGYGADVVRIAYDITIDNTKEPSPAYANAILEKWYAEGLRSAETVLEFEERRKVKSGATAGEGSFDTEDFFNAAIERAFDEL